MGRGHPPDALAKFHYNDETGGESIVIAKSGDAYAIHLKNPTKRRLEQVDKRLDSDAFPVSQR